MPPGSKQRLIEKNIVDVIRIDVATNMGKKIMSLSWLHLPAAVMALSYDSAALARSASEVSIKARVLVRSSSGSWQ